MVLDPGVLRRGVAIAAVVVLLGASTAVAATRYRDGLDHLGVFRATRQATAAPATGVTGDRGRTNPRAAEIRTRLDTALSAQAEALARGDLAAFLAPADAALHPAVRRRYDSLRALRAVGFAARVVDTPAPAASSADRWRATVELTFCAAAPGPRRRCPRRGRSPPTG